MEFFIIFLLILANGVLSMSEIALVSLRKSKIAAEAEGGNISAKSVVSLCADPDKFFSTVQIGITLIGILTGIYSGDALSGKFASALESAGIPPSQSLWIGQAVIVVGATYFTLVFGELVPKRIGFAMPEQVAKIVAAPMLLLSKIAHPFVVVLSRSTALCVGMLRIKSRTETVTEEEIKSMIAEGALSGEVQHIEKSIVERTFSLGDRRISSIMTPRPDIAGMRADASKAEVLAVVAKNPHVVYPVYEKNLDSIIGAVSIKRLMVDIDGADFDLKKHIRQVCFFNENVKVYDVLEEMRRAKSKFAVISNEFGITLGIVTMNDVMDALVGNMPEKGEEPDIIERSDGSYLVDGQCPYYDFELRFGIERDESDRDFNTVAGMILSELGRIPCEGEKVAKHGYTFEIVDMDGVRIDKVLVEKQRGEAPGAGA